MPLAIFVQKGDDVDYIPAADAPAGTVIVQGNLVGVARLELKAGRLSTLAVAGTFDFPVASLAGWTVGDLAYWNAAAGQATETVGANKLLGKVVGIRPGSVPYVRVRLDQ